MAEPKKIQIKKKTEEKPSEIKDKIVDEEKAIPEQKVKQKIEEQHAKLTKETKKAYSPQNVVEEEHEARPIYLAGVQKTKHIVTRTYKNGVIKNKLVGMTKGTGADKKVMFDKGIKE